jgi:hypothetical protein
MMAVLRLDPENPTGVVIHATGAEVRALLALAKEGTPRVCKVLADHVSPGFAQEHKAGFCQLLLSVNTQYPCLKQPQDGEAARESA